jgi:hypothetical protein
MWYVQFSPYGRVVLCVLARSCDGGTEWLSYRVATLAFAALNFPAIVVQAQMPVSSVAWFHIGALVAVAVSAVWWAALARVGSRVGLWSSTRRVAFVFAALYLVTATAATYMAQYLERRELLMHS